jgi:hypothetical protein
VTGGGGGDGSERVAERAGAGGPLGDTVCPRGGPARARTRQGGVHARREARGGDAGQPSRPHDRDTSHTGQGQAQEGKHLI